MHDIRKRWKNLRKSSSQVNTSLRVIISAVLLLELMTGIMFYAAQNFIQRTMERMVRVEMNAIYLCLRNQLAEAEVTIDNMSWVAGESLDEPNWMFELSRNVVKNNSIFWGCGIAFVPNYYASKGRYYGPYSVRRGNDSIESLQMGRGLVDYTKREYYRFPMATGESHWSEAYTDHVGVRGRTTTYSAPIRDTKNRIVGVILADIPVSLLQDIVNEEKHVLVGHITEILRHGKSCKTYTHSRSGGFVHLTEDHGGLIDNPGIRHFMIKIISLTGPLTYAGEYGISAVLGSDIADQLLDQDGLSYARTSEESDLTTLLIGAEQVNDLDTGLQDLRICRLLGESRCLPMDRMLLRRLRCRPMRAGIALRRRSRCHRPGGRRAARLRALESAASADQHQGC